MFISGINIDLKRNKHKIRRMECAIHDESVRDVDKLQTLSALALCIQFCLGPNLEITLQFYNKQNIFVMGNFHRLSIIFVFAKN